MFSPITLNDKTFLYSEDIAKEYLYSLGFDQESLQNIFSIDKLNMSEYALRSDVDNWELIAEQEHRDLVDMCEEIEELCNKLASGKGGTKIQYADRIKNIINEYL